MHNTRYAPTGMVCSGRAGSGADPALGHPLAAQPYGSAFGHARLIDVLPDGMLAGAADPRSLVGAAVGRRRRGFGRAAG
ncbi:hypothetical protein [Nonomuraea lactucae]|uniref:hypothetical protein n=1 Tax=Nonomuraea lactucae TaxID=2249762 RepID=UPI000DE24A4F|nr:hypothetical protein [Nonomuraea lactucae]